MPPSRAAWLIDGELRNGHTVEETLAYMAWHADYADEMARHRSMRPGVVSPDGVESRWVTRLRRWFR